MTLEILLALPVGDKTFFYKRKILEKNKPKIGQIVKVKFRNKKQIGIVLKKPQKININKKLLEIESSYENYFFNEEIIESINFLSKYTCNSLSIILKNFLSGFKENLKRLELVDYNHKFKLPTLSDEQKKALSSINKKIQNSFNVISLYGVTGSGKTRVYMNIVKEKLKKKFQCLILVPEIILTKEWVNEIFDDFGIVAEIYHSSIKASKKANIWNHIILNKSILIIGTRSSLFLPFKNLGIIVVDEEHDSSYKQDEGIMYNARDMAVSRASFEKIPINLVTSIPSIETFNNIKNKKYSISVLKKRYKDASLPKLEIIDLNLRKIPAHNWISSETIKKVSEHLEKGDQILFFLNRRGFAPFVICKNCHLKFLCPNCSVNLNYHKSKNILLCHYCGFKSALKRKCINNESCDFIFCGPGVERIAEELKIKFPKKNIEIFSSDSFKKKESKSIIDKIENNKINILVGTQLISKGFHFPKLNCIIVIDADFTSHGYDLRAAEKNIQMYHQLIGRAGRDGIKSTVYFQTHSPKDQMLKDISNEDTHIFLNKEIELRKKNKLPPFYRFISLIVTGKNEKLTEADAIKIKLHLSKYLKQEILGPVNAPIFRINKKFRCRLLIRVPKENIIQKKLNFAINKIKLSSGIKLTVDVDPISFN